MLPDRSRPLQATAGSRLQLTRIKRCGPSSPPKYVRFWLRLLRKSGRARDLGRLWTGCTVSGRLSRSAEAVGGLSRRLGIGYAFVGCGGGLVACIVSRLRFWTVAVSRNSSRAPLRPRSLRRTSEWICLASPNRVSILFRAERETR